MPFKSQLVEYYAKGYNSKKNKKTNVGKFFTILCKLCEHILHSTILTHLANHKILSDAQHVFRKRSCDTQLLLALNDFSRGLEDKSQTDVIFLDFAKAFDKVSHQGLLKKPITMVIVGIPLNGSKVFSTTAHSRW